MYKPCVTALWQLLIVTLPVVAVGACTNAEHNPAPLSTIFSERWMSGVEKDEPPLQIQAYNADTFVIRQSLETNFEAPFLYLLFGTDRALLIDTGAGDIDLRSFIDAQIETRAQVTGQSSIALTVMHSHAHGDHVAGDTQFEDRPNTTVVGHKPEDVAAFFGIVTWPTDTGTYDLGNRTITIIPTPGHQDSHVVVFDEATRLLFSGDVIYPGRLYFRCNGASEYKRSIDRVAGFAEDRDVSWVLGAHIELFSHSGKSYSNDDRMRTDERLLELPATVISDVQTAITKMEDAPRVEAYDNFTLFPIPENPQGKSPPDWCTN